MFRTLSRWRLFGVLTGCAVLLGPLSMLPAFSTSFVNAPDVAWANPGARTVKDLGLNSPLSNLGRDYDCAVITYTMLDDLSRTPYQGCFSGTAFGYIDYNTDVVLLNGANGAEQVLLNGQPPAFRPFPYSAAMARFGGFPPSGTYMYITPYFPAAYHIVRDALLRPHLELDLSHELPLRDSAGRLLAVNPLALGFSGRGEWMVTEAPGGSLIRMNTATYEILPFAPAFYASGFPYASYSAAMAITQDGRYAAYASAQLSQLKVYDLASCTSTASTDPLAPDNCQSYDYWPYLAQSLGGTVSRVSNVSFIGDGILKFTATVNGQRHDYELAPAGSITSLIPYLGLGDSYAAGEGAGAYLTGTDTTINHCHISVTAYPLRLSSDVFGEAGHSVACSGAATHDVTNASKLYAGQVGDHTNVQAREGDGTATTIMHNFMPGYLPQQDFVEQYRPGVVTVGVGGNDVGFSNMLIRCISPLAPTGQLNPNDCYSSYEDRLEVEQTINRAYASWLTLYQNLLKQDPEGRVYAIGYPQIVAAGGSCGLNVHMTPGDIDFTRKVITYLNSAIAHAAHAAGVTYVDISQALEGYELCQPSGSNPAMNGLSAGSDELHVFSKGSYHPTAFGQELIEQAILRVTNHFTIAEPSSGDNSLAVPQDSADDPLLQAPKTGRTVRTVVPAQLVTSDGATAGQSLAIQVNAATVTLTANSSFTVTIGTTTVGTVTTGSDGSINGSVVIPPGIDPGIQPVTVTGPGASGDPVSVTAPVYVSVSSADTDGDGIPDEQDSCPGAQNSGVDADHDGLDDACDTTIQETIPPSNTGGGTGTTTDGGGPAASGAGGVDTMSSSSALASPPLQAPAASLMFSDVEPTAKLVQPSLSSTSLTTPTHEQVREAPAKSPLGGRSFVATTATRAPLALAPSAAPVERYLAGLPRFPWYLWLAVGMCAALLGYIAYRQAPGPVTKVASRRGQRRMLIENSGL